MWEGVHLFQEKRGWRPGAPRHRAWRPLAEGLRGSRGVLGVLEQDAELCNQTSEKTLHFRAPGDQEVLDMSYNARYDAQIKSIRAVMANIRV